MQVIDTTSNPSLHWPGIRRVLALNYKENESAYKKIYDVKSSKRAHEEDVESIGLGPAPVQKELETVAMDVTHQGHTYKYTHMAYGLGYAVSKEERMDNLYAAVSARRSRALMFSMMQTKELVAAAPLNLAFNAVLGIRGDGASLIANNHVNKLGPDFSNIIDTAADISELSLESMATQIALMEDQRGHKINARPRQLIIHPSQHFEAARILNSVLQSNSASNNQNVLMAQNIIPSTVVNPYMTDIDAFFIQTTVPDGLTMFERSNIELREDTSFGNGASMVAAYMRFSVGASESRAIYGSPGA